MEMKKCTKGHYYDASIHAECPYCTNMNEDGVTLPLEGVGTGGDDTPTMPLIGASADSRDDGKTMPLKSSINNSDPDEGKTVALIKEDKGIDPVVGWLVCIDGAEKGRDYRIHADNNFIGRSDKMDICIRGDETISRDNHAIISYDTQDNVFYFSLSDGRAIVRVNDKAVFQTIELKAHDRITIGKTVCEFIPFCNENFSW